MIWKQVEENWRQVKGKIRLRWKQLSRGRLFTNHSRRSQRDEPDVLHARREVDDWFCRQKW